MAAFSYKAHSRAKKSRAKAKENKSSKTSNSKPKQQKAYTPKKPKEVQIPCLLNVDYAVFNAFRCVGIMGKDELLALGLKPHRYKKYKQSGWIKEVVKNNNDGTKVKGTCLTRAGYEFARTELYLTGFYTPQLRAIEHDLEMSKFYVGLTKEERDSWMTETELKIMFAQKVETGEFVKEERADYSACDGAFIDRYGEIQIAECIGKGYTQQMIQAKQNFASAFTSNEMVQYGFVKQPR